jgi:L-gulonate 3-dehydrogenase
MTTQKKKIAIVGAGLVGSGWAVVFARAGYHVAVYDPSQAVRDGVLAWAEAALRDLKTIGLVENPEAALSNITVAGTMEAAVDGAIYVQESVFETVEIKSAVSLEIDRYLSPGAIVGSSSSGIPASKFTEACANRARFLIAHPVNPPHLVRVVELVPAPWTDPAVVEQTRQLMIDASQVAVALTREIDGFILNRLQGALLNEAWSLYADGYASIDDIDATISAGLGMRWLFMGPFETIDLNAPGGIADYAARFGPMYHNMALSRRDPKPWAPDVIASVEAERRKALPAHKLTERRDWRDLVLARLAAFKQSENLS